MACGRYICEEKVSTLPLRDRVSAPRTNLMQGARRNLDPGGSLALEMNCICIDAPFQFLRTRTGTSPQYQNRYLDLVVSSKTRCN